MRPNRPVVYVGVGGIVLGACLLLAWRLPAGGAPARTEPASIAAAERPTDLFPGSVSVKTGSKDPAGDALKAKYHRPAGVNYPADNAFSPAREELGRALFFDPRLSGSNWISCASCHNPALDWGDGLPKAIGHGMKVLGRRTPTVLNLAWAEAMFWDGRMGTLEEQALGPIEAAGEMNLPLDEMEAKLRAVSGYKPLFDRAYPGEPISRKTVARAIATFERTIVSAEAPFDKWIKGEERAMSEDAVRGFALFNGKANCAACHGSWRFTDDSFHDIGVPGADRGRGAVLPDIEVSQFAFKTPTLRNVDRRAPYLHDGSLATLQEVIELYDRGGDVKRPSLSREIRPLKLTPREKGDLLAFLKALTSVDPRAAVPALPR
jgi:cytochrome c peroxidase